MSNLKAAVAEYQRRAAIANKAMRGASHARILAEVAEEYGVPLDDLDAATLRAQFTSAT